MVRKTFASLDIAKFVLSIVIVFLHLNPLSQEYGYLMYPWVRVAVPLFFMISSFLLFSKIDSLDNKKSQLQALFGFAKRNLTLYAVWFVILLPVTLLHRKYFTDSFFTGLWKMLVSFVFSSTFSASWFIMALVLGAFIIYFFSQYVNDIITSIIVGLVYILCCIVSNYGNFFDSVTQVVTNIYPAEIFNSVPVSLLWIFIGRKFAQGYSQKRPFSYKKLVLLFVSMILLYAEQLLINKLSSSRYNDCYVMLIFVCTVMFSLLLDWNVSLKNSKLLRVFSTVTYCLHLSLRFVVAFVFEKFIGDINVLPYSVLGFLVVLLICAVASYFVYTLQNHRYFRWVKYLS